MLAYMENQILTPAIYYLKPLGLDNKEDLFGPDFINVSGRFSVLQICCCTTSAHKPSSGQYRCSSNAVKARVNDRPNPDLLVRRLISRPLCPQATSTSGRKR